MKVEQFDYTYLRNEYGLSCIEDYVLYLLAYNNICWQSTFFESYLQFNKVLELVKSGQNYSHFAGIPRLHKTGEKLGFLKMSAYRSESFPKMITNHGMFAMQVTTQFMKEKFNKVPWREDHYVLFQYNENGWFEYLNDIPAKTGTIMPEQMKEIYAKSIILIETLDRCQFKNKDLVQQCLQKVQMQKDDGLSNVSEMSFEELRDAIGVTKVLIKRMIAFVEKAEAKSLASEYYEFLSNYYIKTEYMRIRKSSEKEIPKIVEEIKKRDECFREWLMRELEKKLI